MPLINPLAILVFCGLISLNGTANALAKHITLSTIPPVYKAVSKKYRIPAGLLYSIAMVESQTLIAEGMVRPWPWTLNTSGTPHRFRTSAETVIAIKKLRQRGVRNIDVGLMQINWIYHGHRFNSYADHVNPYNNLDIAASILVAERKACGDWRCAVGRYHSRKIVNSERYIAKVRKEWEKLHW